MPNGETMESTENPTELPELSVPNGDPNDGAALQEDAEPQNERELSQTDHLNKSLLTSFLTRLNDPSASSTYPTVAARSTNQQQDHGAGGERNTSHHGNERDEDSGSPWLQNDGTGANDADAQK